MKARLGILQRIRGLFQRIAGWFRHLWSAIVPGPRAWKGAAAGLIAGTLLVCFVYSYYGFLAPPRPLSISIAMLGFVLVALVAGSLLNLLLRLLVQLYSNVLHRRYRWVLIMALVLLVPMISFPTNAPTGLLIILGIVTISSLLGAAAAVLVRGGWKDTTTVQRLVTITGLLLGLGGLVLGLGWLLDDGYPVAAPPNAARQSPAETSTIPAANPAQPGPYPVLTLTYGSGSDPQRPEFGPGVDLVTEPVDGSKLVSGWDGFAGWIRSDFWGFDLTALPLNGRVWYPEGPGPFPLVLVVHGNHAMEDFSDPGYAYLGELLASRGFILVSVDENFLNGSWTDLFQSLQEENDARGWLLLEHLRLWHDWNTVPGHPFFQKANPAHIALIGHSRGGEAIAHAAAFNRLSRYPDNAEVIFDYHYNIQALVAIAPADGQYQPAGQGTPLKDVHYFVLQGAADGDVQSFMGARQYARISFSGEGDWFKAILYVYGANHGQFNTSWGRADTPEPIARLYNLEQLLPAAEQEQIAAVYISAFLEATLHGRDEYRPLFQDYRAGADWLPDTIYLNRFEGANDHFVCTFEEDIDVESTTIADGWLEGQNLETWREQRVAMKWGTMETSAVYLGWDQAGGKPRPAGYSIGLPKAGPVLDAGSALIFSLADARSDDGTEPIDLTVELRDAAGQNASLPLSHFALLQPQIEVQVMKAAFMNDTAEAEPVFQSFVFPLADFAAVNPNLNPAELEEIRLIFDRTERGEVILDNVGFRAAR